MARRVGLERAVAVFVEDLEIRKVAPATLKAYRADLAGVSALLPRHDGPWMIAELTGPVLHKTFARFADGRAAASVARARGTWSSMFDLLVEQHLTAGNPMAAVPKTRTHQNDPKPLAGWDRDTIDRLVTFVMRDQRPGRRVWPELDQVVIAMLLGTGLRSSELLGLNVGSIETSDDDFYVRVMGKGAKPRSVPLPAPLPTIIEGYLSSRADRYPKWRRALRHPLLVAAPTRALTTEDQRCGGRRMTDGQLDYQLRTILVWAGLGARKPDGAMAHAFRHTYGTLLAAEGTPVADLRGLMGHASLSTTQGYLDSVARDRQAAAAANPALAKLREASRDAG